MEENHTLVFTVLFHVKMAVVEKVCWPPAPVAYSYNTYATRMNVNFQQDVKISAYLNMLNNS